MRSLSTPVVAVLTAILALGLLGYVFLGGGAKPAGSDLACTPRKSLAPVKAELFRRAAAMRPANDSEFARVAQYSVVRPASRIVRRYDRRGGLVACRGSLALDLPPGIAVVGGRRTLQADLRYTLAKADGRTTLRSLAAADGIVVPLSTVRSGSDEPQVVASAEIPELADQPPTATPAVEPDRPAPRAIAPPIARPAPKAPAREPSARRDSAERRPATAPAQPSARPSFNCRYARTRGELAVCGNGGLAALDRRMASQFYSALDVAGPAERRLLQRTRGRFLRVRDSCATAGCMANAYQSRMREISDIMAGRWGS